MKTLQRYLPLLITFLCVLSFGRSLFQNPARHVAYDLQTFGQFPVLHKGRIQPLDSFARNNLLVITHKQSYKDARGHTRHALEWLLGVMSATPDSASAPVFRIEHDAVLSLMNLKPREGLRYSLNELLPRYQTLIPQVQGALAKPENNRDLVDTKMIELFNQLEIYRQLMSAEMPLLLPPRAANSEQWLPLGAEKQDLNLSTPANAWYKTLKAYRNQDTETFNMAAREYLQSLHKTHPHLFPRLTLEQRFNLSQPFYQAMILLVLGFLLSLFSWMFWGDSLRRSAFATVTVSLVIFTLALLARMYIQGRPPVTNLYSSAIFVGWVAVLMGLGIEFFMKNGFGTVMASMTGFCALLVAHNLGNDGDTLEMMRAVLDTNFWLATHVTTVTKGYAATFLAGFMGLVVILMGVFSPRLDKPLYRRISGMIYGTVAFATLFSFVGTVLGGIWADQSWGRFWGWDPKENGAVIIVLWNAIILHARWGGLARQRGIALLAIGGNIVTAWSWFGVNMLGVGLHSYGFMDKAFVALVGFVLLNILVICIGSLPEEHWLSFRKRPSPVLNSETEKEPVRSSLS
jgi:ABC-type transport system involved in cytochrome c biogenesis permease subunit